MASGTYKHAEESWLTQSPALVVGTDVMRIGIGRTSAYTVDLTNHQYKSSVATVQLASAALATVSCTLGVFDASVDPTFVAVPAGTALNFLEIHKDAGGADTANPMLSYIDGISVTPNGGDIVIVLDNGANKIFAIS